MDNKEIEIRTTLYKIEEMLCDALKDYNQEVKCLSADKSEILDELHDYLRETNAKKT